jgi:deoxyribonuclease V
MMMKAARLHRWNLSPTEAIELQRELAHKVVRTDDFSLPVKTVAGIDLGYDVAANVSRAVVAVLELPGLEVIETQEALMPIQFPYIPGLLSFREIPVVIEAVEKLKNLPDLILYDGVGVAHPRRFGIASHVGVVTDIPTIGVAKSLLTGNYEGLGEERGSTAPIMSRGEVIGMALRTREGVKPVFVSIGHRISLKTAVEYVFQCTTKYRLPETTRIADKLASYRRKTQPSLF